MVCPFLFIIIASQVTFHPVNDLDIELVFLDGLRRVRECLHNTMIGDRNGRPAPAGGRFYEVLDRYYCVHRTHRRMGMQLDTLDLGIILPLLFLQLGHRIHEQNIFIHIGIKFDGTTDTDLHAILELAHDVIIVLFRTILAPFRFEELLAGDAI